MTFAALIAPAPAPRLRGGTIRGRLTQNLQRVSSDAATGERDGVASIDLSDAELVARAQQDDRRALDELVRRHHAAVARLLWSFVRTRTDLEDLVQETFLRMLRGLPGWRADRPFLHWLLRIASNTGRDYFRRQTVRHRTFAPLLPDDDAPPPEPIEPGADPAARAAAAEVKARLAALPPDDRLLLTLHHLEGWSLAEIAHHCGWTVTATKLRAWRARRRLRALLEPSSP